MEKQIIRIRGHHLIAIREEYFTPGLMTGKHDVREYGEKNVAEVKRLLNLILNENVDVLIIDGLDDMCYADCRLKRDECTDKERKDYDYRIAKKYGFEIGKSYSASEVISKLDID